MSRFPLPPRPLAALFWGVACCFGLAGCAIFGNGGIETASLAPDLPMVAPPVGVAQLELVFVERPVNDPLLGSPLWRELDQIAGIPATQRLALGENGFRVALAGSQPPPTLEAMLAEFDETSYDDPSGFSHGHRMMLREGAGGEVKSSISAGDWDVQLVRGGTPEERSFAAAEGVLRVELIALEDGWAEIQLTPEVHHGREETRRAASASGWSLRDGRQIETLPEAAFRISLGLNELLVFSADDTGHDRIGNYFFRREDDGRLMQRVLVVRLAHLDRATVARQ